MKTAKDICTLLIALTASTATWAGSQLPMRLWYNRPAMAFEESLPLGNGRLGMLVYGNPNDDVVQLNDLTLWSGTPVDPHEDEGASRWIPEIRHALFDEDYARADSLQLHVQGHNSTYYQPLGTLHIIDRNTGVMTNYHRELDLDSALVHVSYQKDGVSYRREYLCSAPDQLGAIRLTASARGAINAEISLTSILSHKTKAGFQQLTMTGHAMGPSDESTHFCSIVRVEHQDGTIEAADSTLLLKDITEATIWFVNATSFNGATKHPVREGAPYLEEANDRAWHTKNIQYAETKARHVADYKQFFDRVKLDLLPRISLHHEDIPTDSLLRSYGSSTANDRYLETLYFQFGRYLLISCSRTPAVPANLQGLWNPHQFAPWRGNYTININLEENYWPAFVANLAEMAMPLDGFIAALAETGRHTAENYYGVHRGWCAGHNSDIWAMANPVGEKNEKPEWANWPMGGAWLVETLWEHYLFTGDEDYLRQTAYPLMKGAAEFCLDWLIPNPKNPQELITAPSTSPENEYVTDKGYHGMTCYGSSADMAIIRELFQNIIKAGKKCGDDVVVYENALARLHPYTVGKDGDLNEWYYDWRDYDPKHRHQSHLIGLYPGNNLPDSLYGAAEKTLIQKGEQTTGWSTGWRINLWARLHKGDQAYHIYRKLLKYVPSGANHWGGGGTYPNLFDAHPPFQIDGNFGGVAGVCEMLLQSHQGMIELLPALPADWSNGEVSGLCARGGYEVSMKWQDGKVTEVAITAKKGGNVVVQYNNKSANLTLKKGQPKHIK
jgi:alpha-L-fucosidase 2